MVKRQKDPVQRYAQATGTLTLWKIIWGFKELAELGSGI